MRSPEIIQKNADLFAYIFLLAQRLEYISNKLLEMDQLTTKQFLLLAITEKAFDHEPSLKEVADALGTTHQNVRQMANQLEKKGFIEIFKDPNDKRVNRLRTTEANRTYWDSRAEKQTGEILDMFKGFTDEEIESLYDNVTKLYNDLEPMYREFRA
jgi:DNA-binding MarR family transcriptional regulator